MQPNIPVVFHLSGKDWDSLEAQIRAEFCVNFFTLSSPNLIVYRVTQILKDYFFQVNLTDVLYFGTSPQLVGLFQCLRFCGTAALGLLVQAEVTTVLKRKCQLPKHPQLQGWPFLNTEQLCSSSRCLGLGTNACEVPVSFRVEIWVCPILLHAPAFFRELGVWSGRKL